MMDTATRICRHLGAQAHLGPIKRCPQTGTSTVGGACAKAYGWSAKKA
jgi:hypothetical protein